MEPQAKELGVAGLWFFSKMTAANAHEAKNALAIINESAGLLEDLVMMAAKGHPLDPKRLARLAVQIRQQVTRADDLAKNSHRLAHSLDFRQGPSHLSRTAELAVNLGARFAAMAQVELKVIPGSGGLSLPVSTFHLLHLIWLALEFALAMVDNGGTLNIQSRETSGGALLRLAPLAGCDETAARTFITRADVGSLAVVLNCKLDFDPRWAALELKFEKSPPVR